MTVREALRHSAEKLRKIYDEGEATAISEWLIESLTDTKRGDRFAQQKKLLDSTQLAAVDHALSRLLGHEPIQYVLNESWFCGLRFYVDPHVLIPRPETEELVEWVISNCRFPLDDMTIADIGSGSGCIPIALKKRLHKAVVTGFDLSPGALDVARTNAARLGIDVDFHPLDFLDEDARDKLSGFDIIVSNPPYIPAVERQGMDKNVYAYEPEMALFVPDEDPLVFYKALVHFAESHLNKGGSLYMETHASSARAVAELCRSTHLEPTIKKDMQGVERMVRARRQ